MSPAVKAVLFILTTTLARVALAEGGHHEDHGVPWGMVGWQIANFAIFAGVLVYFLRSKITGYFGLRQSEFAEARQRAEQAQAAAEQEHKLIREKMTRLEATSSETIQQAQKEAAELQQNILQEAKAAAARIEEEARKSIQYELERAKEELRQELLKAALEAAHKVVKQNIVDQDQKRLQGEFVNKVQVVTT